MNGLRVVVAVSSFCISSYLIYDLCVNGFDWSVLVAVPLGYLIAHFIWPKKKEEESEWYQLLEFIVDLPYQTLAFLLRSLGRLANSGIDAD